MVYHLVTIWDSAPGGWCSPFCLFGEGMGWDLELELMEGGMAWPHGVLFSINNNYYSTGVSGVCVLLYSTVPVVF